VNVIEAAVADEAGRVDYYESPGASPRSSSVPGWASRATRRMVPAVTVASEMRRLNLQRLDFLKVDVEGFDLHVLRGARGPLEKGAIGFVQFEYNEPWMYVSSTLHAASAFLTECGYEMFLLSERGLCRCDTRRLGELFAYLNFVAVPRSEVRALGPIHADPLWG
jgi:hypothetical protein